MKPSLTVLVVEDSPDEALLMKRAFQSAAHGIKVPILPDGSEAIAYLCGEGVYGNRAVHPFPDMLILDLKMPKASGFEVLEWLRVHLDYAVIPTIVWTSSNNEADVKHAYCLGANAYLVKPVDFGHFKEMVADLLRFWKHVQKPSVEGRPSCAEAAAKQHL